MPNPPAPMSLSDADYEAIEGAVVETNRGRWFLAEYARRNRHADTRMLLAAIDRLEAAMRGERTAESVDRIRFDLVEMAKAIARTKAEIAAIKPDAGQHGKFGEATAELDSIVGATEAATSDILAAAEQIQEVAWTLREQGLEAAVCDMLDAKATEVYTACSFQDLTGQRTGKVIQVLRYLEGRINAMIDIWGLDGAMAAEAAETARARNSEAALVSGPALPGHGLDQADVDVVMGSAAAPAPVRDAHPIIDVEPATMPGAGGGAASVAAAPSTPATGLTLYRAPIEPVPLPAPAPAAPPARFSAHDPMALLDALSAEEKIALFS